MANGPANQTRLLLTVLAAALATPVLILGAWRTMDGIYTSALHWLEPSTPERARYDSFCRQFEGGNFMLLSWEGCTIKDPRLTRTQAALESEIRAAEDPLFERAFSGRSFYDRLAKPEMRLSDAQARERLQGSLIGPDGKSTCLFAVLTERGARDRAESLETLRRLAKENAGLGEDELRIAGPAVDSLAVDIESDRSVDFCAGPSLLVSFLLCVWCLRLYRFAIAILMVAGFGELMVLGSLYFFGVTMNAVLIVLPPLVFVLTVSAGIHVVNYYFDKVQSGAGEDSPRLAIKHGWLPCALAALTTAIGLGSLLVSRIVPVYTFGSFAAGGVMISVALLFLTLPGVMSRWPARPEEIANTKSSGRLVVALNGLSKLVCRYATLITIACTGLLVWGAMGLTSLRTSVGIDNLLPPESRVVRDFKWIEEHVANLAPLEVILSFPKNDSAWMINRLDIVSQVQEAVRQAEDVGGVLSVATFAPDVPRKPGTRTASLRGQINAVLRGNKQELIDSHYLAETDERQLWRISARVSGAKHIDFEEVLGRLRSRVEPKLDELESTFGERPQAVYTGVMPLVFRAQHALLEDMFASMLVAFGLVWLVMSAVLFDFQNDTVTSPAALAKCLWLGALAMLPNLFPIVVVFGAMGWLGWPADIGSTMTACVALGIAVDDTLHFLAWYRRETARGNGSILAIRHSFKHCGRAMIQTTVVCGVGMLFFGFSGFVPTQRFAVLMFTLLTAALAADLVFLPAILASPLGSLFAVKPTSRAAR